MLSRHTKRAILGLFFLSVLLLLVIGASWQYFAARELEIRLEEERANLIPAEPLLLQLERQTKTRTRSFAARLEPFHRSAVAAETSARVLEVFVNSGDSVSANDLLVRLDPTLAELAANATAASLQAAESQLREFRRLADEAVRLAEAQTVPETRRDAALAQVEFQEAQVRQIQAELRRQQEILQRHEIRAPFAGTVNQRLVDPGVSVSPNEPVATIASLDPLRARFHVSDLEVRSFQPGQNLAVHVTAFPETPFTATVSAVAQAADPVSGLFLIEALVPNPENQLPAGVQARLVAEIEQIADAIFVPASAIRFDGERALIRVQNETETEIRELRIGREIDGHFPVFSGLDEGETIVIH